MFKMCFLKRHFSDIKTKIRGNSMSPLKVVRLLAVAIAVIGAFTAIPEAALIMVLLGLALGFLSDQADKDNRTFYQFRI